MKGLLGVALLVLGLLSGCGPEAALWVRVEAPLRVPEQADALQLSVWRASGALAFERTYPLDASQPFPQTLMLLEEQAHEVGAGPLEVEARALLGGVQAAPWSQVRATVELESGQVGEVVLRLCDCVPEP